MLLFCNKCKKHKKCVKVCRKLENYLNREQSKEGYSSRWIRAKEIPFSNNYIEDLLIKKFQKRFGGRKSS